MTNPLWWIVAIMLGWIVCKAVTVFFDVYMIRTRYKDDALLKRILRKVFGL